MLEKETAYQNALEIISKAKSNNASRISFNNKLCRALEVIPEGISELTSLRRIDLSNTKIEDLTPIASIRQLGQVEINRTEVNDLSIFSGMTEVFSLSARYTKISDLSPISDMTQMTVLQIDGTNVSDLKPISNLVDMQALMIGNNEISDLAPLYGMKFLTSVWIDHTSVSNLDSISHLDNITRLSFDNTQVSDLQPISDMIKMTSLSLDYTQVTDLKPISNMTLLKLLSLSGTNVSDLSPISKMNKLKTLSVNKTMISSIEPLSGMIEMEELNISKTKVSDLSPVLGMSDLNLLYLQSTDVVDLTPISNMKKLTTGGGSGVAFVHTPAAYGDEILGEISLIRDNAESAEKLLEYLNRVIPPPEDNSDVSEMEIGEDGVLKSRSSTPNEVRDPDQEDMRKEVLRKVQSLISEIGLSNDGAKLSAAAVHYRDQVDQPLTNIKLGLLYSAFNTLRLAMEAEESAQVQGRLREILPPNMSAALSDLVQTHGLFFMGFPEGVEVHAKAMSSLTTGSISLPPEAEEIVNSLVGQNSVLAKEDQAAMQDDLAAAKGDGPSAQIGAARLRGRIWNMMGAIGRASWKNGKWVASAIITYDLTAWMVGNKTIISSFLIWAQGPGAVWFRQMLQAVMGVL